MFYPSGSLRKKGTFSSGEKVGLWKTFSKSGDLHLTEVWDNGRLLRSEDP